MESVEYSEEGVLQVDFEGEEPIEESRDRREFVEKGAVGVCEF